MKRKYKKKSRISRKIALERVNALFNQAKEVFKENHELANRCVHLARKTAMKFKVRIPSELQRRFCKHCYKYIVPNVNCRVRSKEGHMVYYCLECKKYMRFRYK